MRFLLITLIQHFWFLLGLNPFTTAFREIHIPGFPPMDLPDDFGCLPNRSTDTKVACEKFDCEHQVNDFKTAPLAGKKPAKLQKKKNGVVLPGKLTCPLKITGWKMYSLLQ